MSLENNEFLTMGDAPGDPHRAPAGVRPKPSDGGAGAAGPAPRSLSSRLMRPWQQCKNIFHFFRAHFWRAWFGFPDRGLKLYGVTGTNGKTTTCYLLTSILAEAYGKENVGMLTTVAFRVGATEELNETKMTTLKSYVVYRYLRDMRAAGVTHAVLEITSHALDQFRLAGLRLDGGIILNVAREHLDYHRTLDIYADAKARIINYLKPHAPLVGKADDSYVAKILTRAEERGYQVIRFTSTTAQVAHTPLQGAVNQENAMAATRLARAVGVNEDAVVQGVQNLKSVPGRNEWLDLPTGARAVIDYAVTPDALERLYKDIRDTTTGKIFAVLGAAGLRDRGKRPDMARVVAQYADEIIITREDPWTESEEQIFNNLEVGLRDTKVSWSRIVDRREALRYCLQHAGEGDVVVATGKGAETGMGIGKAVVPWNEREIILEITKEVSKKIL